MSRLLFAAARGARIQTQYAYPKKWATTPAYRCDDVYPYRIHPEDVHLQYGPISTALQKAALQGNAWDLTSDFGRMAQVYALRQEPSCFQSDDLQRSLFLLFLAEALADEGL